MRTIVAGITALVALGAGACKSLNTQEAKGTVIGAAGGAAVDGVVGHATGSTARGTS